MILPESSKVINHTNGRTTIKYTCALCKKGTSVSVMTKEVDNYMASGNGLSQKLKDCLALSLCKRCNKYGERNI